MLKKRTPLAVMKAVLFALVLREMRGRFGAKRMGAFWFIFEPLSHIMLMAFVMSYIRGRHLAGFDFPVFLVTGMVPFLLFKGIVLRGMAAVDANRALFAYRQVTPLDCIIARSIIECVLYACVYVVLMFIMGFWIGYDVGIAYPLRWLGMLAVGILFSFSLAVVFCIWVEAVPEIKTVITLAFLPLYFLSGVLIPVWLMPVSVQYWMSWNPFFQIIEQLRIGVFVGYPVPIGVDPTYPMELTLVLLFVGLGLYQGRRDNLVSR